LASIKQENTLCRSSVAIRSNMFGHNLVLT